jgi:tryptophan synthase beta subunit
MSKKHAATLTKGSPGVLHGSLSYLLQDDEGQIIDPHSISAGWVDQPLFLLAPLLCALIAANS